VGTDSRELPLEDRGNEKRTGTVVTTMTLVKENAGNNRELLNMVLGPEIRAPKRYR
jgi:hypothetical protein